MCFQIEFGRNPEKFIYLFICSIQYLYHVNADQNKIWKIKQELYLVDLKPCKEEGKGSLI